MMRNQKILFFIIIILALIIIFWIILSAYLFGKNSTQAGQLLNSSLIQVTEKEKTPVSKQKVGYIGKTQNMDKTFYSPVLMYHHVALKRPQNSYYVSPEIFDQQMAWLKDNNYTVISYDQYQNYVIAGKGIPEKPVVITFDDGDIDHYTNAFPILKKYGYTATFFIKINNIGANKGGMTWEMIKDLAKNGMTIGSHSVNHDDMVKMSVEQIDFELQESKKILETNLNIPINFFAYPGGAVSASTIEETKKAGYLSATTTKHKVWHNKNDDNYQVPRIHIDDEMPSFINWVQGVNL